MSSHSNEPLRIALEFLQNNRPLDARAVLEAALQRDPEQGELLVLLGAANYELSDFRQARTAFETARMLVPLNDEAQCLLADCYANTGCATSAKSMLHSLWRDRDCAIDLLPLLAATFGRVHEFETAAAVCRRAAELQPHAPEPLFGLAFYLRRQGYPAASLIPVMSKAADLAPDVMMYQTQLAFLLAEAGRTSESYDLLCRAPVEELHCACELRRAMAVFRAVGDYGRWNCCLQRLHQLQDRPTGE